MTFLTRLSLLVVVALLLGAQARGAEASPPLRVVSLDSVTTETFFALGAGDQVVGCDEGSAYPEAVKELPKVSSGHQVNAEAALALRPALVIGRDRPMSQAAFQVLGRGPVRVEKLSGEAGIAPAKENIKRIAALLGKEEAGAALIQSIETDLETLRTRAAERGDKPAPKVLAIYLRPEATLLLGDESNAMTYALLAGAENAAKGISGFQALNAEAVINAAPDIILCYTEGLAKSGGIEKLLSLPGVGQTPAARNKRVVAFSDQVLGGFGPRLGKTALALYAAFHETEGPHIVE